jgi:hypothetical protein
MLNSKDKEMLASIDRSIDIWKEMQSIGLKSMNCHNGVTLSTIIDELEECKALASVDRIKFRLWVQDLEMFTNYLT